MKGKKWKILHFIDSEGLYGAESVLLNLSGLMARSDHYVPIVGCIVSSSGEQSDLFEKALEMGLAAEKVVLRNSRLFLDLPRAANQFKSLDVHLIHSHGYKPSVFGYAIKLMTGIQVMATCHLWFKGVKGPLKMRLMVALELYLYRFFQLVVGVSEPIKDVLIDSGVSSERILVIKNGVEVGEGNISSPDILARLRKEIGLGDSDFCILNTGRLTKQKAQRDIITAAGILRDRGIKGRFLIVGEGELMADLQHQIVEMNLDESVQMLGFRDDISDLLQVVDLFVLPSLDEGMPMSLLEAAALGLPVVASQVGDIPKLIEDKITGFVVPAEDPQALADAIARQMEDPRLGCRLGEKAQKRVREGYSTEAMFLQYDQLYLQLLGQAI